MNKRTSSKKPNKKIARPKLRLVTTDDLESRLDVWERQDRESIQSFEAFEIYRKLEEKRSTAKVAHELGKSKALIQRWSARWSWVQRCLEWDRERAKQLKIEEVKQARDRIKQHGNIARLMLNKVVHRLMGDGVQSASFDAADLTPTQLAQWLETGVKIERLSMGEVTEHVSVERPQSIDQTETTEALRDPIARSFLDQAAARVAAMARKSGGAGGEAK